VSYGTRCGCDATTGVGVRRRCQTGVWVGRRDARGQAVGRSRADLRRGYEVGACDGVAAGVVAARLSPGDRDAVGEGVDRRPDAVGGAVEGLLQVLAHAVGIQA